MYRSLMLVCLALSLLLVAACESDDGGAGSLRDTSTDAPGSGGADTSANPDTGEDGSAAPTPCTSREDCAGLAVGPCRAATCDTSKGSCVIGAVPDGQPCDDACSEGGTCTDGVCGGGTPAAPQCGVRECGEDACGNLCGECGPDSSCLDDGTCQPIPPPGLDCDNVTFEGCCTADGLVVWCDDEELRFDDCPDGGRTCGWSDEDGYFLCARGQTGDPSGANPFLCEGETCEESCEGKTCGWACGESCGSCGEGEVCQEGACAEDPCQGLDLYGCCDGDLLRFCEDGQPGEEACGEDGCGWDPEGGEGMGWYACGGEGIDPSGQRPIACPAPPGPVDEDPELVEQAEVVEEPGRGEPQPEVVEHVEPAPDVIEHGDTEPGDAEIGPETAIDNEIVDSVDVDVDVDAEDIEPGPLPDTDAE